MLKRDGEHCCRSVSDHQSAKDEELAHYVLENRIWHIKPPPVWKGEPERTVQLCQCINNTNTTVWISLMSMSVSVPHLSLKHMNAERRRKRSRRRRTITTLAKLGLLLDASVPATIRRLPDRTVSLPLHLMQAVSCYRPKVSKTAPAISLSIHKLTWDGYISCQHVCDFLALDPRMTWAVDLCQASDLWTFEKKQHRIQELYDSILPHRGDCR